MAAANTDKFKKSTNNFSTTLTGAIVGASDTSMSLASTTNLPTDTGTVFVIDRVNSSGVATPTLREYVIGTVSGSNVTNLVRGVGNSTAQAHSTGAVVEQVVDQRTINDLMDGILAQHNQDGSHGAITATSITTTGNGTIGGNFSVTGYTTGNVADGWNAGRIPAPNTVTYNGNRSYSLVFNSTDLTGYVSPGMRLKTTRTVTAPTQCTSLNGTTQYYSKTSPAGMTFTDDFVVSAWVKLPNYTAGGVIASRYNGTSGWYLYVNTSGQVTMVGTNAGAPNFSQVASYQSVPLNRWVHIAAQLDMSTFTATPTTSYVMIDGVDVPASVTRGGTNPTSLTQAGNLEIGSFNGGLTPTNAKIAQVAIYSAKVTEATIAATISQGLVGTETNLISAYSFNGSINDLNANANNLTPNGSAVATATDSPFSVNSFGTATGTTDYGIVTSATFSTNTTLVVQVPEGNTIPTSGGVSAVSYSVQKVPYGFPAQRGKWNIESRYKVQLSQSTPTTNTWYFSNAQLSAPVGEWELVGNYVVGGYRLTALLNSTTTTLSTSSAAAGADEFTTYTSIEGASATVDNRSVARVSSPISLAATQIYYLNYRTIDGSTSIEVRGDLGIALIRLENAYL